MAFKLLWLILIGLYLEAESHKMDNFLDKISLGKTYVNKKL